MTKIELNRGLLLQTEKPARYVGGERNQVIKELPADPSAMLRFAFCFPDTYEIGMSNAALQIIYGLLNERHDVWCERVFAPWTDMERLMRAQEIPLYTLESRTPLHELDVLGFTLQYELSYTNVLNMLDLGRVPVRAADRGRNDPLVVAGGPVVYNAEPMADFFDFMVIGDAEKVLGEIADKILAWKQQPALSRQDLLLELAGLEGVYVPSLYDVSYDQTGLVTSISPRAAGVPALVRKRMVRDLDTVFAPTLPVVPNTEIVHDRMFLEIFRGCPRGCRFCQAGMAYRPMREKSPEALLRQAGELAVGTGYDEMGLLSLSTSDYTCLPELTLGLLDSFEGKQISLSLPSLRVDNFSLGLMDKASSTRKTGLTFAPEAGSQRLRDVINKGVTEEDLMTSLGLAFRGGYDKVKLYFMLGLPTETDEDVLGIASLADKILKLYKETPRRGRKRNLDLVISTALFIPKPDTPFQWAPQVHREELIRRRDLLRAHMPRQVRYNWHEPDSSLWEAVLARGDRRLGAVVQRAWEAGQTFDSWDEHFHAGVWAEACRAEGLDPDFYALRERGLEEVLPWQHIDCGVRPSFLKREWAKALKAELTAECREQCQACGAQVYEAGVCPTGEGLLCPLPEKSLRTEESVLVELDENTAAAPEDSVEREIFTMRVVFAREGSASMLAHLDVMRTFERSLRRADMPLHYSEGFNPRPQLVFALPLGVGIDAERDYVDVLLTEARRPADFVLRLNSQLPPNFRILNAELISGAQKSLMSAVMAARYRFEYPGIGLLVRTLEASENLTVDKFSKGKTRSLDIRPLIVSLAAEGSDILRAVVKAGSSENLRPDLLLKAMTEFCGLKEDAIHETRIIREDLYGEINGVNPAPLA